MEKEKQLTAVEWLLNELSIEGYFPCGIIPEIENQAKAMEKEQIMNAVLYGFRQDSDGDDWQGDNYNAEKYYNKTFK